MGEGVRRMAEEEREDEEVVCERDGGVGDVEGTARVRWGR